MTVRDLADAVGASCVGAVDADAVVSRIVTDSREVRPGDVFAAIVGEHFDGHVFAGAALEAGAVAVLACRETSVAALRVGDTVTAIGTLARAVLGELRRSGSPDVIAVTGSVGKTSTKDLLAHVLGSLGPTIAPPGSFNTELGLPLTVLDCDASTQYLVLEMGARGVGHIAYLAGISAPRVGVVLGVGSAHLGEFGSIEAIAQAKGELVEALPAAAAGGVAVLNADDRRVLAMATRTPAAVMTFGTSSGADVCAESIVLDDAARPSFRLVTSSGSASVRLRLHGAHAVIHALAAATVGVALGMSVGAIAVALESARAVSRWRMEVTDTPAGVTLINDAYNANPDSMRAAIEALLAIGGTADERRTWAVLGTMHELGPTSVAEHEQVGRLAVRGGVSRVVTVGQGAHAIHAGAQAQLASSGQSTSPDTSGPQSQEALFVPDISGALKLLQREVRRGDTVLVKASRAEGLEQVALALLAAAPASTNDPLAAAPGGTA